MSMVPWSMFEHLKLQAGHAKLFLYATISTRACALARASSMAAAMAMAKALQPRNVSSLAQTPTVDL
jgi:hypothetical protein